MADILKTYNMFGDGHLVFEEFAILMLKVVPGWLVCLSTRGLQVGTVVPGLCATLRNP